MAHMTARHLALVITASVAVTMGGVGAARGANPPAPAPKGAPAAKPATPAPVPVPAPPPAQVTPTVPGYEIDSPAQVIDQLYGDICIPNYETPEKIRAYAAERHLQQITNPQLLPLYIGQGPGAAWVVPSPLGSFVLSIREEGLRCAVWAREAEPLAVDTYFRARVDGNTKPGFEAFKDRDTVFSTPAGNIRAVIYVVTEPDAYESVEMMMLAAEKSGSAFQASYQIAKQGKRSPRPGQARLPPKE